MDNFNRSEVNRFAEQISGMKKMNKIRDEINPDLNLNGSNFNALAHFKPKCEEEPHSLA